MQQSPVASNTRNDEDHDYQCWKDVEAETGFSSYKSYLGALKDTEPQARSLLKRLIVRPSFEVDIGEVFVLDILKDGSTSISFDRQRVSHPASERIPRGLQGSRPDTDQPISTQLLQNLRSAPENVPARIVLWSIQPGWPPHAGIIEALALGLDIHFSFFVTLFWITSRQYTPKTIRPNQILIGDSITTIARDYRPDRRAPPVLIIAGNIDLGYRTWTNRDTTSDKTFRDMIEEVLKGEIGGSQSLYRWATQRIPPENVASLPSNHYLRLLSKHIHKDCNVGLEGRALLLLAMLPLLSIEILRLHIQRGVVDSVFIQIQYGVEHPNRNYDDEKQESYSVLDAQRFWLRRRLEGLEVSRNAFIRFARSQGPANWLEGNAWRRQNAHINDVLATARAKDAEVRDYLQLQIGNLSILRSKTSIQLSNQQIDEAKRGKVLPLPISPKGY